MIRSTQEPVGHEEHHRGDLLDRAAPASCREPSFQRPKTSASRSRIARWRVASSWRKSSLRAAWATNWKYSLGQSSSLAKWMKSAAAARASSCGSWVPASAWSSRSSSLGEALVEHHQEQLFLALEVRVEGALRVSRRPARPRRSRCPRARACRTAGPPPRAATCGCAAASRVGSGPRCVMSARPRRRRRGVSVIARRKTGSDSGPRRLQLAALDQLGEHDLHLELRERPADAAANAAPERDPRVRPGRLLEEPLGLEALRVRVDVGAAVDQVDRGRHRDPGGQLPAADLDRLGQPPRRPARSPAAAAASR